MSVIEKKEKRKKRNTRNCLKIRLRLLNFESSSLLHFFGSDLSIDFRERTREGGESGDGGEGRERERD